MALLRHIGRRAFLAGAGAATATTLLNSGAAGARVETKRLTRLIPATGEPLPAVGMGSWITFNVPEARADARAQRVRVLQAFFDAGGGMIDSSPMYGHSEEVIGHCLRRVSGANEEALFSATKIWTPFAAGGPKQMRDSERRWGLARFDLNQVHNLVNWEDHLQTLRAAKEEGRVRYLGVTTSHGRRHGELESVMDRAPLDFVQLTYNVADREAERRLIPMAADRGMAVIANRPYRRKALIHHVGDTPLPGFAAELQCRSWAQLLLKFIISHPDVTVAIPATTRVDHMRENMDAMLGPMPDADLRRRIVDEFNSI